MIAEDGQRKAYDDEKSRGASLGKRRGPSHGLLISLDRAKTPNFGPNVRVECQIARSQLFTTFSKNSPPI